MQAPVDQTAGNHWILTNQGLRYGVALSLKHQKASTTWLLISIDKKTAGNSQARFVLPLNPAPVISAMGMPLF